MTLPMYGMKIATKQTFFYDDAKRLFEMLLKLQSVSLKYEVFLNDKNISEMTPTPYAVFVLQNQSISFTDSKPLFNLLLKLQQMHINYELFEDIPSQ